MYRNDGFKPRKTFAPVKVGDELDVKIEAVGEKGDGIAKKNGFVLFVPGVKEGDEVKIRVTKVLRKVGFAEAIGQGSPAAPKAESSEEDSEEEGSEEESSDKETEESEESEESEDVAEDSEDFGEELEEDK
jgi:predicted RNA-binding protein with TRAM domain